MYQIFVPLSHNIKLYHEIIIKIPLTVYVYSATRVTYCRYVPISYVLSNRVGIETTMDME